MRIAAIIVLAVGAGCAPALTSDPATETAAAPAPARSGYTEADVQFMQHMLVHHAQAVEMTSLVPERASGEGVRLLARRIERSQDDEMARMRTWLVRRGEAVPDEHAHHGDHAGMPGMASAEELARLRAATGAAFDRLFLELMIRHHEGALVMVEQLFATPGAGQEPLLFQFASHVDADQRMEIQRMRSMLQ